MNIYQKLNKARTELQNLELKKSGYNDYSKYSYYELGDFLPAINAICDKLGLFTKFSIVSDRGKEKAVLTVYNADEANEKVNFIVPTAEVEIGKKKDGTGGAEPIQNLGGKITYMRRYMLFNAFEMVESDSVERIKQAVNTELEESEIEAINKTKTFVELTAVCGKLKSKYGAKTIEPLYKAKRKELEIDPSDKIIKEKK